ncbi:MAG TPA: ComF family protein [Kiritimatiellia bacterium]|jgi:ComF family protein
MNINHKPLTILLDLLFPRACGTCGSEADDAGHVCWSCRAGISMIAPPLCAICGDAAAGRIDDEFICHVCAEERPHFDFARSAARYDSTLRTMIQDFKYHKALWFRDELAGLLRACVDVHYTPDRIDVVAAVPLYHARQRERGYNQAAVLASALARRLRKPVLRRALVRVRPTATQTRLTAGDRLPNVKDAFEARRSSRVEGKNILLVDDVMTTGATLSECARALKVAGARSVYAVTLARGV